MKGFKKVLLAALAVMLVLSMSFAAVFAAESEQKTFVATANGKEGGSQLSVTFSIEGLSANCQRADKVTGIGDHIKVNGVLVSEAEESDPASQVQIHQRSNMFWIYTSGYQFKKGDTVEFLAGMGFVKAGEGDAVCEADSPKIDATLAEDYKVIMALDGNWAVLPADGAIKISGLEPLVAIEENLKDYASKQLTLKFESLFSGDVLNDLQKDADVAGKIKFGGKTVTEINAANTLENKFSQPVDAIRIDSTGSALVFTIDDRAEVNGKEVLADLTTFSADVMTTPSGLELKEAYTRTYYATYDYWVTTVSPVIPAEGDKVLHFKKLGNDWSIGGDATNKSITFEFYENICDETNAGAGNANFYASLPRWILSNATGRTVESVDKAVSSGAYEAALTKILVDGQDIRSIQAGIEGEAAKSTAVMLHYNKNRADIYIPAALIALDEDHVITIKAGMVFPTGYYVEQDMVFTYSAATQKLSTTSVTDITLNKTEGTLAVGDTETLVATIAPAGATNKMVEWSSSDESVATVDENGKVTALKAGTATITAKALDGDKTATFTLTVKEAATSVTLNKTAIELSVGASETLTATIAPSGADDAVEWTTSDESVATVDENGKVTAVKAGTATITVTTKNGKTATCTVTVKAEEKEEPASGGCGSAVAATASALGALLVAGAVVVLFRKK